MRWLGITILGLLTGCSILGHRAPTQTNTLTTTLPPAQVALLVAEQCRQACPGADPLPEHGGAPVLRESGDTWRIYYQRTEEGTLRLALNGRLVAQPAETNLARQAGSVTLATPRFLDCAARACLTGAEAFLHVRIAPQTAATTLVQVNQRGNLGGPGLTRRLARLLRAAESADHAAWLLRQDLHDRASDMLDSALARDLDLRRNQPTLAAHLLFLRGSTAYAQTQLQFAATLFEQALRLDPDLAMARLAHCRCQRRLARIGASAWSLQQLTGVSAPGGQQLQIQAALNHNLRQERFTGDPKIYEQQAKDYVGIDVTAARNWSRRAAALGSDDLRTHLTLADTHEQLNATGDAFDEEMLLLARGHGDPQLILRLARRHQQRGNPEGALHLLASHWPRLQRSPHRQASMTSLANATKVVGPARASRILFLQRRHDLALAQLQRWCDTAKYRPEAARTLLSSLAQLRDPSVEASADLSLPRLGATPAMDRGFRAAPGIAPMR